MGDVIWDIVGVDINAGEFYTAAPVIWEDPSIWGNAGNDYGGMGPYPGVRREDRQALVDVRHRSSTGDAANTWPDDPKRVKAGGGHYSS
jgi:hypothetical protein